MIGSTAYVPHAAQDPYRSLGVNAIVAWCLEVTLASRNGQAKKHQTVTEMVSWL